MSTTLPEPVTAETTSPAGEPHDPMSESLQDRLPEWFRTPKTFAIVAGIIAFIQVFLSYLPVWHTDIWGHLAYGRYIVETGRLPATEPLLPLSTGIPFVDTAWLSQVLSYSLVNHFGTTAIRFLFSASIATCCGLLMFRLIRRTGELRWAMVGLGVFAWLSWQQFFVPPLGALARPQLGGLVCFVALLTLITGRGFPRWGWLAVPALMAVWANLHGSFPVGVVLLGTLCVGRAADLILRSDRIAAVLHDRVTRRLFLLTELAFAATLLNPYGLAIWSEVFTISSNPNLTDLVEWEPLTVRMRQGQAAAVIGLLLFVAYRLTPRRVSVGEVLLHVLLGAAACWTSRMILWWAPVAAYTLVVHGSAAWRKATGEQTGAAEENRSIWTVAGLGLVMLSLLWSPFGQAVVHPRKRLLQSPVSQQTPVRAVEYLVKNPPSGQIFNTYELGDFLLWAGDPQWKLFVASHAHLAPPEVWQHYLQIVNLGAGWEELLDQYSVNTLVLDQPSQRSLIRTLKRDEDWRLAYEDNATAVLVRRKPI